MKLRIHGMHFVLCHWLQYTDVYHLLCLRFVCLPVWSHCYDAVCTDIILYQKQILLKRILIRFNLLTVVIHHFLSAEFLIVHVSVSSIMFWLLWSISGLMVICIFLLRFIKASLSSQCLSDIKGTYVEGIKEEVVLSPAHALSLIATGEGTPI